MQPWDRDQIHRLFDDLEFRVLRDRLFDTLAAVEPEVDEGFDVRGGALEPGTVGQWLAEHVADGRRSGLAVVGTHLPYDGDATALAIAAADGDGGYLETATLTPEDDAALAAWLADAAKPKALHEAKLAIHDLAGRGWTLNGVTSDTALAAYLVRPGQRSFTLDDLSLRYLRRELRAETSEQQQLSLLDDIDGIDEQAVQTAILRARAVVDLADALDAELDRIDSTALLGEMELPVQQVLADLEAVGIAVDLGMLTELQSQFGDQIRDAAEAAYAVIGKQINLGSPKQLQVVLFDELEHAEDQAHQDRLHHRRRRPAVAVRQDRAPVPAAPAGPPRRHPAQGHRRRAAELGGRRRPHPHHVQPDDRGDRPALVDRAQPAEHPDPHRRRPPDSRRVRGRQRADTPS